MAKIIVLQHIAIETPGIFSGLLKSSGHKIQTISAYQGQKVPKKMENADALLVMGGPMGVYEQKQYPYLAAEMRLMENALRERKPVLGICLGSQLLASVLGAPVKKGKQKEIGWYPVKLSKDAAKDPLWKDAPKKFMACHWHGDIFDLPKDAVPLAASSLTRFQAFRYEKAYGNLFHMEVTAPMLRRWVKTFDGELKSLKLRGRTILDQAAGRIPALHKIGRSVFQRWMDQIGE